MASFPQSLSEDGKQERESEDSDQICFTISDDM